MFDNVGRNTDKDAGTRMLVAAVLVVVLLGTVASATAFASVFLIARKVVQLTLEDVEMVDVDLSDQEEEVEPPEPPKPPEPPPDPGGGAAAPEAPPEVTTETPPEDPPDDSENANLDKPDESQQNSERPPGDANSTDADATGSGKGPGFNGKGDPRLAGAKVVHYSEVSWKYQPKPEYPKVAMSLGLGEVNCKVRISIDEKGTVEDLEFLSCPPAFQPELREKILKWKAYPVKAGSAKTKATFLQNVKFKLQ